MSRASWPVCAGAVCGRSWRRTCWQPSGGILPGAQWRNHPADHVAGGFRRCVRAVRAALSPFLTADGDLADTRPATLEAAMQAIDAADPALRRHLRVSRYLAPWIAEARRRAARNENREAFLAEVEAGTANDRRAAPSAAALPARGHAASCLRRARAAGRRHGPRQDHPGDRGMRTAAPAARHRSRAGGVPGVAERRVAGADRPLQRRRRCWSPAPGPARLHQYTDPAFFTVVNYEQVVIDADDINRTAQARHRHPRRGAADQELAHQDGARGEVAGVAVCVRADRHADREPHRRDLFDRAVPRSRAAGSAVPLQPRFLRARRTRPADRLSRTSTS